MPVRGRPFPKGNPGRSPGTRRKTTLAMEALLEGEAEALSRKAIELALAGDTVALKLCLDRVLPIRKGRPVVLPLPRVEDAAGVRAALTALVAATAQGEVTPDEATGVAMLLEAARRGIETQELEERLRALEERMP